MSRLLERTAAELANPTTTNVTVLRYTQIRTNGGTQMRAGVNEETAGEYADELRRGGLLPPVVVFFDGTDYWLGDGFHRVRAHFMAAGSDAQIPAEVRPGTRRDAVLCAAGANAVHGLRRTNADKWRAVEVLLCDEEWGQWSNREIARRCKVSEFLVRTVREKLDSDDRPQYAPPPVTPVTAIKSQSERTYTTKHGTVATMNVTGQRAAAQERAEAEPDEKRTLSLDETIAMLWRVIGSDLVGHNSPTDEQKLQSLGSRGDSPGRYWPYHTKAEQLDPDTFAKACSTVRTELQNRIYHARRNEERQPTPSPLAARIDHTDQVMAAEIEMMLADDAPADDDEPQPCPAYVARSEAILAEVEFWRVASNRVERVGELTGQYTAVAPLRRAIEEIVRVLGKELMP